MVRHQKDRHEELREQHYCPHSECRMNEHPFTRKDNYLRHLRDIHGQDHEGEEKQEEQGECMVENVQMKQHEHKGKRKRESQ